MIDETFSHPYIWKFPHIFHLADYSKVSTFFADTRYDKIWRQFWYALQKITAEQPSLTQYERPIYHMKEK